LHLRDGDGDGDGWPLRNGDGSSPLDGFDRPNENAKCVTNGRDGLDPNDATPEDQDNGSKRDTHQTNGQIGKPLYNQASEHMSRGNCHISRDVFPHFEDCPTLRRALSVDHVHGHVMEGAYSAHSVGYFNHAHQYLSHNHIHASSEHGTCGGFSQWTHPWQDPLGFLSRNNNQHIPIEMLAPRIVGSKGHGGVVSNSHGGVVSNSHGGVVSNSHGGVVSNSRGGVANQDGAERINRTSLSSSDFHGQNSTPGGVHPHSSSLYHGSNFSRSPMYSGHSHGHEHLGARAIWPVSQEAANGTHQGRPHDTISGYAPYATLAAPPRLVVRRGRNPGTYG
jgi:hypothetical protein